MKRSLPVNGPFFPDITNKIGRPRTTSMVLFGWLSLLWASKGELNNHLDYPGVQRHYY